MVEITVSGRRQFQRSKAYVVECFIVDAISLVRVLDELMDGQGCVVGLDDGVGHFGRGDDAEGHHDPVRILLPHFGDQQRSHTGPGATTCTRQRGEI